MYKRLVVTGFAATLTLAACAEEKVFNETLDEITTSTQGEEGINDSTSPISTHNWDVTHIIIGGQRTDASDPATLGFYPEGKMLGSPGCADYSTTWEGELEESESDQAEISTYVISISPDIAITEIACEDRQDWQDFLGLLPNMTSVIVEGDILTLSSEADEQIIATRGNEISSTIGTSPSDEPIDSSESTN